MRPRRPRAASRSFGALVGCLGGVSVNRPIALGLGRLGGRCFRKWRMPPALSSAPIAEYIPSLFAGVNGRIHKGERSGYQSHPRPIFFVQAPRGILNLALIPQANV
ncbi:Hypothetical protein GbCGDNIH4_7090 [Granulibacter bethesdensis CGDNIH4]|nr:Hypothetical protein GbCGDNIH4_7090 [Granulibacter bethesdensis CGDNIH4]